MKTLFYILLSMICMAGFSQENLEISKIKIKGQDALSTMNIKENLTLETTSWFKQKILKKDPVLFTQRQYLEDIRRLTAQYHREGYLDVSFGQPEIAMNKREKVELTIFVREGKPVEVGTVNYMVDSAYTLNETLPAKGQKVIELRSALAPQAVFRDEDFHNDRLLIAEEFNNVGYPYAVVDYDLGVDTVADRAKIDWFINRGDLVYFGNTTISGNKRVPDRSIRKLLKYEKGEIWSKKQIDQTQKLIYNQGMYRVASLKAQIEEQQQDTVPIHIQIEEAPRWTTRFGGGYGREDKVRVFTELQYLGFLTNTGRLNMYAKHSGLEPYHFYVKFSQPSLFFPINTLLLHPYLQKKREKGYHLTKHGFNISMQQNFSKQLNTMAGFELEEVRIDTTTVAAAAFYDPFADPNQSAPSQSSYDKSSIILGAIYNNADPILDPVQGYALSVNFKNNGLIGSHKFPFYRILAEYKHYIGLKNGVVLALKAKAGGLQPVAGVTATPVDERFFGGGSNSVRGWPRHGLSPRDESGRPIGGNSLLEGSAEFRINITRLLILAAFADAGNVWEKPFDYNLGDLRYAAGAGLRIKTPIGPAGIDFARPVFDKEKEWQIHFNIGHSF